MSGAELLDNLDDYLRRFWLVKPKAANPLRCCRAPGPTRNNKAASGSDPSQRGPLLTLIVLQPYVSSTAAVEVLK